MVQTFPRCEIVGRRFPICHVHIGDDLVEVSLLSSLFISFEYNVCIVEGKAYVFVMFLLTFFYLSRSQVLVPLHRIIREIRELNPKNRVAQMVMRTVSV